ncbi:MAG: toll/interleukin-1 receptor domain-containing protein [Verrucomicrobia bacterium]|nr:toll/interleukin-1 receptor domain-containing protein [Verrucomicrobiota bacterium]
MLSPAPTAQEFFWDDLLEYIAERRVIPIVGAELLTVPDGAGGTTPLMAVLAARLAERLRVPADDCTGDDALHQVVCRYMQRGGRREEVYPRLRTLMKELAPAVPPILRELARIRHFSVFVTTTFDSLLAQALDEERFGGAPRTVSLAYAPTHNQDLPADARGRETPTVFHLLGRMSASPDYVITEEDTLEFFTAMQSESKRPNVLLDELKTSHLLLIGNTFPDWLARFFIRIAKHGRLSLQREELEIIADRSVAQDPKLVLFLRNFSYRTQIFEQGSASDFVHELSERYLARNPTAAAAAAGGAIHEDIPTSGAQAGRVEMRAGAVFLSYASQDAAAVKKIRDALEAAGIDVWFDQRRLEGGDDFDKEIKRNIRGCSLFVPVISAQTQARHEGYFRLEWSLAAERSKLIAETIPFILPVVIDPVSEGDALVPERFLQVQWTRLPGGAAPPEFVERMVRLIREFRKREKGLL